MVFAATAVSEGYMLVTQLVFLATSALNAFKERRRCEYSCHSADTQFAVEFS
jgi:hypothetical protein